MRVVLVTTSYPRGPDDHAGRFVGDAVERLERAGVEVDVVAPGRYDDHGLARGDGVAANARRRPWLAPLLLASMTKAVREAARDAELVHAHWLPAAAAAAVSGRPFVVTLHGTDVHLARHARPLARLPLSRARVVVAVSSWLAAEAPRLGARRVEVIPNGIDLPAQAGVEAEPPEVLYAGRLAREKGIEELVEAAAGLDLVVVGDGPLRSRVPGALGFLPREELDRRYARAAVFACPSRREGFGVACAEAMGHGKPVVATAVGGLVDLVRDGKTGLLVPPRDPQALRAALLRLLGSRDLRLELGANARRHVASVCSWDRVVERTLAVYEEAVRPRV